MLLVLIAFGAIAVFGPFPAARVANAQEESGPDVVIALGKDTSRTIRINGEISDWVGNSLTIKVGGRMRTLANSEIVDVQIHWSPAHSEAEDLIIRGQFNAAIEKLKTALREEQRTWAQTIINAKLVQMYSAVDNHSEALAAFGAILAADSETRFLNLAPIPWAGSTAATGGLATDAENWMNAGQPVVQLIGASWLLSGTRRSQAEQKLEQLANGNDPAIAAMATAQLWRTVLPQVTEQRVARWKVQISEMPADMRAGPYFVIGLAQGQLNMTNDAALDLMRVRILFPGQYALSSAALYKSATLLENAGQSDKAIILQRELIENFGDSPWATQVDRSTLNN